MKKTKAEEHFDKIAPHYDYYKKKNQFYYSNLKKLLRSIIPFRGKVLEIGTGTGDLLASLDPSYGYGMDISTKMISIAKSKHRGLIFSSRFPKGTFDYVFMSDVVEHLVDPMEVFVKISGLLTKNSIFINTMANPIWEPMLMIWENLGLKMPEGPHNRIRYQDMKLLIEKSGMKIVKHDYKLLIPIHIPLVSNFVNRYLQKYFKKYSFIEYFIAVKS